MESTALSFTTSSLAINVYVLVIHAPITRMVPRKKARGTYMNNISTSSFNPINSMNRGCLALLFYLEMTQRTLAYLDACFKLSLRFS